MSKVLITGGDGQLGQCIKSRISYNSNIDFYFKNSKELDITNTIELHQFFQGKDFSYLVNCAAFTNVELAEKEPEKAYLVNAEGVKNLAEACKKFRIVLIHISTDYVFDGTKRKPYTEEDITNPINVYGKSKLVGEQYISNILNRYFIIRTSWLYSSYGKNFYKTILEKAENEDSLKVIDSETGTPTNGLDLADLILRLVKERNENFGLYHFTSGGESTWYDFAKEILEKNGKLEKVKLEKVQSFPTIAKRPEYSVLATSKISKFGNFKSKKSI